MEDLIGLVVVVRGFARLVTDVLLVALEVRVRLLPPRLVLIRLAEKALVVLIELPLLSYYYRSLGPLSLLAEDGMRLGIRIKDRIVVRGKEKRHTQTTVRRVEYRDVPGRDCLHLLNPEVQSLLRGQTRVPQEPLHADRQVLDQVELDRDRGLEVARTDVLPILRKIALLFIQIENKPACIPSRGRSPHR